MGAPGLVETRGAMPNPTMDKSGAVSARTESFPALDPARTRILRSARCPCRILRSRRSLARRLRISPMLCI